MTTPQIPPKKEYRLFKCRLTSCSFVFPDGQTAIFVNGKYATDKPGYIQALEKEIEAGHPHIYVDQEQRTVDYNVADPLAEFRNQVIKEYLADQARIAEAAGNLDAGNYEHGPMKVVTSKDIATLTVGVAGKSK